MTQEVFIHIGMPRSASTFLQREVFPKLESHQFLGLEQSYYSHAFNKLQFADQSFYNPEEVREYVNQFTESKLLLSNESFVGQSVYFNHSNRTRTCLRLKEIFPQANIILILRNQIDLLTSMYNINLQGNESGTIDDFVWFPQEAGEGGLWGAGTSYFNTSRPVESPEGYNYSTLLDLYESNFENVHVLLFEEMVDAPQAFSEKLAVALGVDQEQVFSLLESGEQMNQSVTEKQAAKLRRLNKYQEVFDATSVLGRGVNKMKRKVIRSQKAGEKPQFSDEVRDKLVAQFKPWNEALNSQRPELGLANYASKYYLD